jgi:osmotically-inducible protein OsmY
LPACSPGGCRAFATWSTASPSIRRRTNAPIQIEEAVRIALDKDPLFDASQIRVGVRGRTVRLTGWVPSAAARDAAEWDAWYVFGVDDVINEIETGA